MRLWPKRRPPEPEAEPESPERDSDEALRRAIDDLIVALERAQQRFQPSP